VVDEAVETAVDVLMDRAGSAFRSWREARRDALPEDYLRQKFTCAACRKEGGLGDMEMVHPTNGFALCKSCFAFVWSAGKEKLKALGRGAARKVEEVGAKAAQNVRPGPSVKRAPPWEVLEVASDATIEEIKKAYRKKAMQWHPDRVPPEASSGEREEAHRRFQEVQRAYDVMIKVRSAPE